MSERLSLELPPELIDLVVERVVEQLERRVGDPWLNINQAAEYITAKPQRIYDLRRTGKLPKTGDGRRALLRRSALDRYLSQGSA